MIYLYKYRLDEGNKIHFIRLVIPLFCIHMIEEFSVKMLCWKNKANFYEAGVGITSDPQ